MDKYLVENESQIKEALDWALAGGKSLSLAGNSTKESLGRPIQADAELNLSSLSGIELYEPAELVMQAKAGTRLSDIEAVLKQSGQKLAFQPPDYGPLLGGQEGQGTIGGIFSANLSGSERIKAGAARDHLLGVKGFSGRGEAFQTGSRVMKNVTGYDLCKLVCGSYGTIALCTDLTFKVLPKGEKARTILIFGLAEKKAVEVMRNGLSSRHEVSAAAYLPGKIAAETDIDHVSRAQSSVTALRVEGPGPSAEYRCATLRKEFDAEGPQDELHGHNSEKFWKFTSDVRPFLGQGTIWKVSIPPASSPAYIDKVKQACPGIEYYFDWGGGLVWLKVPEEMENGGETFVRNFPDGGHATLIRGNILLRNTISPFQPQDPVMTLLMEKVRAGFDPKGIFNPGRMYAMSGDV
ncbi:MAG: FAD-binding protein [Sneathiellales bacterium]|nr:FAD-binding protein [Sneathiellales bacterium]